MAGSAGAVDEILATTQASTAYERLRDDLLTGRLPPSRKLQMRFLMDAYGTGQTPLREALNRLSAEGLVDCREQRGFYVSGVSRDELAELTKTRCWVESIALRESMQAATPDWEDNLVVAHHRLSRTPRSLNPDCFEDNPAWEAAHRTFHTLLIGGCGSRPLLSFCRQLADQLYRYRQISIRKVFTTRHVGDEHRAIFEAVLDKDADRASALLSDHYRKTAAAILEDLRDEED